MIKKLCFKDKQNKCLPVNSNNPHFESNTIMYRYITIFLAIILLFAPCEFSISERNAESERTEVLQEVCHYVVQQKIRKRSELSSKVLTHATVLIFFPVHHRYPFVHSFQLDYLKYRRLLI